MLYSCTQSFVVRGKRHLVPRSLRIDCPHGGVVFGFRRLQLLTQGWCISIHMLDTTTCHITITPISICVRWMYVCTKAHVGKNCVTVTSFSMKGIRLHQIPLLLHYHLLHTCKSKATRKWLQIFTILIVYIVKTLWSGIYVLPPSISSHQLTPR